MDGRNLLAQWALLIMAIALPAAFDCARADVAAPPQLYVARDSGKWGYINATGQFVIPPTYDQRPGPFSHGLALVQINHKFGFINTQGELVIPAELTKATSFRDGLAAAIKGQYRGYLDTKGEWHLMGMFQNIRPFRNGLAVVRDANNRYVLIDHEGENQLPTSYQNIRWAGYWPVVVLHDGEWYYVNKQGGRGIGGTWKQMYPSPDGIAVATLNDGRWDFLNAKHETIFYIQANWVMPVSDGAAAVKVGNKFHFVDMTGERIGEQDFKAIVEPGFTEGLAGVADDRGKFGFINKNGEFAIPPQYDAVEPFNNGLALVTLSGRLMYIDRNGKTVWQEGEAQATADDTEPTP